MRGQPPHLVGKAFLEHFGIAPGTRSAHAFTFLDYQEAAQRYGRMGGFAQLKTLIDRLRTDAGPGNSLLLDGGDLWQGTGQALAMQGVDMSDAVKLLGIDAMTGHWEFTYGEEILRKNLQGFKGEFLAQNVLLTQGAAFNDKPAFDSSTGRAALLTSVVPPELATATGRGTASWVWPPRMTSMPLTRPASLRSTSMPLCESRTTASAPCAPRRSSTRRLQLLLADAEGPVRREAFGMGDRHIGKPLADDGDALAVDLPDHCRLEDGSISTSAKAR